MSERYLAPVTRNNRRSRDMEALRLRTKGWTIDQIAEHLAFPGSNPQRAAANAIKRAASRLARFPSDEQRLLELESLDELEAELWRKLRKEAPMVNARGIVYNDEGNPIVDERLMLETFDRIMKVKERRAKMLGLDAPSRAEVVTIDSIDKQIAELERELKKHDVNKRSQTKPSSLSAPAS